MIDLNKLAKEIHANSVEKGFWEGNPSDQHFLMLVITELSEAIEADRKGHYVKDSDKRDLELHSDKNTFSLMFESLIKDKVQDELADAFIRLLDLAEARDIDLASTSKKLTKEHADLVHMDMYSFTEILFNIVSLLCEEDKEELNDRISYGIGAIYYYCTFKGIDIFWHVEQKMKYNKSREYKHGKKY